MSPQKALAEIESRSDRDLIVIAVTRLTDLGLKVDSLEISFRSQITELKDGIHTQLNDHEIRLKAIERLIDQINPVARISEGDALRINLTALAKTVNDQEIAHNIYRKQWAVIYALISVVVSSLVAGLIRNRF